MRIAKFSQTYPFDFSAGRAAHMPIALPDSVTINVIGLDLSRTGWRVSLDAPGIRYTEKPIECDLVGTGFPLLLPISAQRLTFTFFPPEGSPKGRLRGTVFLSGTKAQNLPKPKNAPRKS